MCLPALNLKTESLYLLLSKVEDIFIYLFIYIGSGCRSRDRAYVGSGYSVVKVQVRRTSQVVCIGKVEFLAFVQEKLSPHVVGIGKGQN